MKSQVQYSARLQQELSLKAGDMKVSKKRLAENGELEMEACFSKLKDLVPTVPQDRKLNKVQLMQHVIDYIMDLELTLDTSGSLRSVTAGVERKPLSESCLNTLQVGTCQQLGLYAYMTGRGV